MAHLIISSMLLVAAWLAAAPAAAAGQASQATPRPILLKSRQFTPPANIGPPGTQVPAAARRHLLVQFDGPLTPEARAALAAHGLTLLHHVPYHAFSVRASRPFDPAAIPGLRWVGFLEWTDKISADTRRTFDEAPALAAATFQVIEFHPGVPRALAERRGHAAGGDVLAHDRLPAETILFRGDAAALARLAARDEVAWIYPASEAVVRGEAVPFCAGPLTSEGTVANYATVGPGWDGPGLNAASLTYHFQSGTAQIAGTLAFDELVRAFGQWSRYVQVSWQPASTATATRSINVFWARGDHGDGHPFGTSTLAHAFYPAPDPNPEPIAGDIHFNDDFAWGIGDPQRYDVFSVGLHEAGHSLGLGHSSNPAAVMYPYYGGIVSSLAPDDIDGIRSLYASTAAVPAGWDTGDIGAVGRTGGSSSRDGVWEVRGSGADIWGTADAFHYAHQPLDGDGQIVARVASIDDTHHWAKAGVMIRESLAAGSRHAFMLVSADRGLAFQRRVSTGGTSTHTAGPSGRAPRWVKLVREGSTFSAYSSPDGAAWTLVGRDTIRMADRVYVGLAVTSHENSRLATAVVDNVRVQLLWSSRDIGDVGRTGSVSSGLASVAVRGAGADIWNTHDGFHYMHRRLRGDGQIVARVTGVQPTHAWAKAGVMIRAALAADSPHAFMLVSAGKGLAFQRRRTQGGSSVHTAGPNAAAPRWVRLTRRGDVFRAYTSTDGASWTFVGSDTISMPVDAYVGLAVTSHAYGTLCEGRFDGLAVGPAP